MTENERILAVDPGKVTGWAMWGTTDDEVPRADQLPMTLFLSTAEALMDRGSFDTVVVEDYLITAATLRKTRGELNWSLEQLGVLRWLARKYELRFVTQRPADAKRFATDEKLRRLGWYRSTPGGHANDALRHLLLYLANADRLPEALLAGR
jgi:hypothetical protein